MRRFIFSIFMLFFITVSALCLGNNSEIRILAPRATASIPFIVMEKKNMYRGLKVELFINHPRALATLLKGDVDFLYTGTSTGWNNYLNGGPLVVVNTGVWGISYLVGYDRNIRNFKSLKNNKLMLPFPGSPLDVQTRYILMFYGINPDKDLIMSYGPFNQAVALLSQHKIDVAPLPEPLVSKVCRNNKLYRLIGYRKAWAGITGGNGYSPQVSLFTLKGFSISNRKLVVELNRVWRNATEWVISHPDESADISSRELNMDADIISEAIKHTDYMVPDFSENKRLIIGYYNIIYRVLNNNNTQTKYKTLKDDFFFNPN